MTKIKKQSPVSKVIGERQTVVFGFSELREYSYVDANDAGFFVDFIGHLKRFSQLDWNAIYTTHRHGFGSEKIGEGMMTLSARQMMPKGVTELIVLRATGNNHAFLGYRDGNTFQVIFIEYEFGDVYRHGNK